MKDTFKHQGQRRLLVKELENKKIKDPELIRALLKVPRHLFLPKDFENKAYDDIALPIDEDQTISQPFTVAFQTQSLEIKPGDKVLEIGTGSGYQAAILAEMGALVYSIERIPKLHLQAKKILDQFYKNIHLLLSDGTLGWPEFAPYNKIIVTAASPSLLENLMTQLVPGGMAILPVGDKKIQKMVLLKKSVDNKISTVELGDFRFVPLIGKNGWTEK
ncbi:MAG: protein-L-isoaspartate(D-aspartate) O-methyltransferase [Flavobacteriales bacterium]|nr:protein-L-isoaspartate(D-aspartate) O-methyltransferase [Flavobacteriales bacterium]